MMNFGMDQDNERVLSSYREELMLRKSANTVKNYLYDIKNFIDTMHIKSVVSITYDDLDDYVGYLRNERDCSGSSINRRVASIKSLTKYLKKQSKRRVKKKEVKKKERSTLEEQLSEYQDILEYERVPQAKVDPEPFSMEELKSLLEAAMNPKVKRYRNTDIYMRNFLLIALSSIASGVRNTAGRSLLKRDCECFTCNAKCRDCIPIIKILRKGKKEETADEEKKKIAVQIKKDVCLALRKFIRLKRRMLLSDPYNDLYCKHCLNAKDGNKGLLYCNIYDLNTSDVKKCDKFISKYIFTSRKKGKLTITQINQILKDIASYAGIDLRQRKFHSLRHTFITICTKNGTDYIHLARQVDHEGPITKHYEHMTAKDLIIKYPNITLNFSTRL